MRTRLRTPAGRATTKAGPVTRAMALAAGLGMRMRPLTEDTPKPLVRLLGRTLLDRVLDHLEAASVEVIVVNVHYKAEMIERHLAGRPNILLSRESSLLETGGGVAKALPDLGAEPFFVVNSDAVWLDGPTPALNRLATAWDDDRMDALLLLQPTASASGYEGLGDFFLDPVGIARRRGASEVAPYLFAGVQFLHPRLFRDAPEGAFSLNRLYDRAAAAGRLYGIVHDGEWYHVGTPQELARAEEAIARGETVVNSR